MRHHHQPDRHDRHGGQFANQGWSNYLQSPDTYIVEREPATPSWVWVALGGALLLLLMRNN